MAIYHILFVTFKPTLSQREIEASCKGLSALGEKCLHPTTKQPYLKMLGVGKQNSTEGHNDGVTHAMVSIFDNEDDREYFMHSDPIHLALVANLKTQVDKVQVVDFTPGEL